MSDHSNLLFNKDDLTEDMLLSQFSQESQFKSQESFPQKKRRQSTLKSNQIIQEENSTSQIYDGKQDSKENQLLKIASHLRQTLQLQQKEFYEKELQFQQKLLEVQQQHETMISLMKSKYQYIIEELKQKIQEQTTEIINLKSQLSQFQEQQINQLTQRLSINKKTLTDPNRDTSAFFTQRQTYHPKPIDESIFSEQQDDKLLNLYKKEIDKIKQQTAEFEKKFQNEKQIIKQEICTLKNQKIMLQTLMKGNPNLVSAERPYSQGMSSEHKTNKSKRSSQSRVFSHISKKSFEF